MWGELKFLALVLLKMWRGMSYIEAILSVNRDYFLVFCREVSEKLPAIMKGVEAGEEKGSDVRKLIQSIRSFHASNLFLDPQLRRESERMCLDVEAWLDERGL